MDLSTVSDLDIALEHSKREGRRIVESTERNRIERLRFTGLVVDRIHEIDKNVPIIIYDQNEHAGWKFKRSDSLDSRFDITVTPWEFGYMKRWNLCPFSISREGMIPLLAKGFIDRIWVGDMESDRMKDDNFYFINRFDIGGYSRLDGEVTDVGYVQFNYEKRSNLIKENSNDLRIRQIRKQAS